MKRDEESPEVSTGNDVLSGQVPQTESKQDEFAGHTPGPWQEGRSDMATVVDGTKSKWVYSQDGQYVAVASGHVDGEWECVMANARLIAAAPRLLRERDEARADNAKLRNGCNEVVDAWRSGNPNELRAAVASLIALLQGGAQ